MRPDISEFSYGYALTDELIHWQGTPIIAAPVFPSLYQEGQPGGGYDVMLQRPGIPLFIQFKLADCMVRTNAQEAKNNLFVPPFYRMHIRPIRQSSQHEMLLDLENDGNDVFYCAPAFHKPEELNDAYLHHQVSNKSLWIEPSIIGPMPDNGNHHVAFQFPGNHYFCSDPQFLEIRGDFEEFSDKIVESYREKGKIALLEDSLNHLADTLKNISQKRKDISSEARLLSEKELEGKHPLKRIAFYSNMFMDTNLYIVIEKDKPEG